MVRIVRLQFAPSSPCSARSYHVCWRLLAPKVTAIGTRSSRTHPLVIRKRAKTHVPIQVAIDGPVASGKSTVARALADRLGFVFLDTGALYRAVAYLALDRGVTPDDEPGVERLVAAHMPEVVIEEKAPLTYRIRIDGRLLGQELFALPVSHAVSPIAAMPGVRRRLVAAQRTFADGRDVVMAGRDIGTVVLPDANVKFYLTATIEARVDRRLRELIALGVTIDRDALHDEIVARDRRDSQRAVSPLVKAPDAIEIDTSDLSVPAVVDLLERTVRAASRA
jgi:CMP/dCMP kinase